MSSPASRRAWLGAAVSGGSLFGAFANESLEAATPHSASTLFGRTKPTATGFGGISLRIVAADDFSPVPGVEVSLTFIGSSWAENSTSIGTTNEQGGVQFGLEYERPGPYLVGLRPPSGSRFSLTDFDSPESLLTIQPDGRYFPETFRIGFTETAWAEMREHVERRR